MPSILLYAPGVHMYPARSSLHMTTSIKELPVASTCPWKPSPEILHLKSPCPTVNCHLIRGLGSKVVLIVGAAISHIYLWASLKPYHSPISPEKAQHSKRFLQLQKWWLFLRLSTRRSSWHPFRDHVVRNVCIFKIQTHTQWGEMSVLSEQCGDQEWLREHGMTPWHVTLPQWHTLSGYSWRHSSHLSSLSFCQVCVVSLVPGN